MQVPLEHGILEVIVVVALLCNHLQVVALADREHALKHFITELEQVKIGFHFLDFSRRQVAIGNYGTYVAVLVRLKLGSCLLILVPPRLGFLLSLHKLRLQTGQLGIHRLCGALGLQ